MVTTTLCLSLQKCLCVCGVCVHVSQKFKSTHKIQFLKILFHSLPGKKIQFQAKFHFIQKKEKIFQILATARNEKKNFHPYMTRLD